MTRQRKLAAQLAGRRPSSCRGDFHRLAAATSCNLPRRLGDARAATRTGKSLNIRCCIGAICPTISGRPTVSPSTPRRWASTRIVTGFAWSRFPPATATPTLVQIAQGQTEAPIWCACSRPRGDEDLSLRPLRSGHSAKNLRSAHDPRLLHQDRLQTDAHLYRPPRPQGLVRELLAVDLSKQQQSSDWGAANLTEAQLAYAASDVLHLHALRRKLDVMLAREGRSELARECFAFCPPAPNGSGGLAGNGYFRSYVMAATIWSQRGLMRSAAKKGRSARVH